MIGLVLVFKTFGVMELQDGKNYGEKSRNILLQFVSLKLSPRPKLCITADREILELPVGSDLSIDELSTVLKSPTIMVIWVRGVVGHLHKKCVIDVMIWLL